VAKGGFYRRQREKAKMLKSIFPLGLAALLGACSYVDEYERHVHGWEPTYCYQSIGGVGCFRTPYHRDERRLVNYFGPHPSRFDKPEPPEPAPHSPPGMVNYWVKDPEPIPCPSPARQMCEFQGFRPAAAMTGDGAKAGAAAADARLEAPPPSAAPLPPVRLAPMNLWPQP
jgi:hypothetical protein